MLALRELLRRAGLCGATEREGTTMARLTMLSGMAILSSVLLLAGCGQSPTTKSEPPPASNSGKSGQLLDKGPLLDEAQRVGREAASFPQADEDYFHD